MILQCFIDTLHWRHNDHDGVSNHQPHGCLLHRIFGRRSKKTSKLRVTGLCAGNSPGPVNSPHKGPVTRKMFPFDDVIMCLQFFIPTLLCNLIAASTRLKTVCTLCHKMAHCGIFTWCIVVFVKWVFYCYYRPSLTRYYSEVTWVLRHLRPAAPRLFNSLPRVIADKTSKPSNGGHFVLGDRLNGRDLGHHCACMQMSQHLNMLGHQQPSAGADDSIRHVFIPWIWLLTLKRTISIRHWTKCPKRFHEI